MSMNKEEFDSESEYAPAFSLRVIICATELAYFHGIQWDHGIFSLVVTFQSVVINLNSVKSLMSVNASEEEWHCNLHSTNQPCNDM